jgi:hypothetical protein
MTKKQLSEKIKKAMNQENVPSEKVLDAMALGIAAAIVEYVKNPEG